MATNQRLIKAEGRRSANVTKRCATSWIMINDYLCSQRVFGLSQLPYVVRSVDAASFAGWVIASVLNTIIMSGFH